MKFYTSPDFNNLPLTNVSTYDQDSINALFSDLATPEELEKFRGLIVDSIVSQYFVYSSNKTMEEINKAKSETNQFASELFAKVSTMSISYVTTLPDVSQASENIIYILEKVVDTTTVHTINLYDKANNKFVECSSIEASLKNVYTKEQIDTKLEDYALKTEVIKTDDLTTEITETSTNGEVPTALAVKNAIDNASVKISAEADNQIVEKTDGIYVAPEEEEISWSNYQALSEEEKLAKTYFIPDMPVSTSGEIIGDVEYGSFFGNDISGDLLSADSVVDFSNKRVGNLTYDSGVKLTKGKLYLINCNVSCISATSSTNTNSYIRFDIRINDNQIYINHGISFPANSTSSWSNTELVTHYECKNDGEVLTVNVVSAENIINTIGDMSHLIITEIPSYQGLIDVSDQHIKEVAKELVSEIGTITKADSTNVTIPYGNSGNLKSLTLNKGVYILVGRVSLPSTFNGLVSVMVGDSAQTGEFTSSTTPFARSLTVTDFMTISNDNTTVNLKGVVNDSRNVVTTLYILFKAIKIAEL